MFSRRAGLLIMAEEEDGQLLDKHEKFVSKIKAISGDDYSILTKYDGTNRMIKVKHNVCGYEYTQRAKAFIEARRKGYSCNNCIGRVKSPDKYNRELEELYGNEYISLDDYVTAHVKLKTLHSKCGKSWMVTPHNLLAGYGCKYCYGNELKTTEEFKKEIKEVVGSEYEVLSDYRSSKSDIKLKHVTCGHIYEATPDNFLRGKRCPKCFYSKGEEKIQRFLDDNGISYAMEHTFDDCVNRKKLRFDFAIYKDGELSMLIEYDGIQHFKPTFGEESFEVTRTNDRIKDKYCLENEIPLLRIPYTDFDNLEDVLMNNQRVMSCSS